MGLPTMSQSGGAVLFCLPCVLERADFGPGAPLAGEPERAVTIAEGAGICLRHLSGWPISLDTRKTLALVVWSARRAREIELRDQAVNGPVDPWVNRPDDGHARQHVGGVIICGAPLREFQTDGRSMPICPEVLANDTVPGGPLLCPQHGERQAPP